MFVEKYGRSFILNITDIFFICFHRGDFKITG